MGSKRLDALGALQLLVINPQQNRTMNEAAMSSTVGNVMVASLLGMQLFSSNSRSTRRPAV